MDHVLGLRPKLICPLAPAPGPQLPAPIGLPEDFSPMWTKEVAFSIVPLAILNGTIVFLLAVFVLLRALGKVQGQVYRDEKFRATAVLGSTLREFWGWFTGPIERALIAAHVTPNMITTMGLILSAAAAVLYYLGHVGSAGYLVILGGTCDTFDGRVARATGQQTRSGAFYDAVLDRVGESLIFIGMAGYYQHSAILYIPLAALVGSLMVSYVRARAEGMDVSCGEGLMQRPERIFLISICSVFDPLVKAVAVEWGYPDYHYLLIAAVSVIALLSWYTTFQRLVFGFRAVYAKHDEPAQAAKRRGVAASASKAE